MIVPSLIPIAALIVGLLIFAGYIGLIAVFGEGGFIAFSAVAGLFLFIILMIVLFFLAEGSAPLADVKAAISALHSGLHGVECANTRLRHQMTAQGVCRLSQVIPDVEEYYRIMHDMQANLRLHQSLLYLLRGLTK